MKPDERKCRRNLSGPEPGRRLELIADFSAVLAAHCWTVSTSGRLSMIRAGAS